MKICPICSKTAGNKDVRCAKCGYSLGKEPIIKGITEFNNPGAGIMTKIHTRHRRLNLRNSLIFSAFVQVAMAAGVGMVHDWTLLVHAIFALVLTAIIHKLRFGHLPTILACGFGTIAVYYYTGHLAIFTFFSLWLLVFWYTFLGYQMKMNNELHGKENSF